MGRLEEGDGWDGGEVNGEWISFDGGRLKIRGRNENEGK